MDELLTVTEVAEYLGVTERTVYNWVRAGKLPAVKVGRLWRVRESDLASWLTPSTRGAIAGPYPIPDAALVAHEAIGAPTRTDLVRLLAPLSDQLERRLAFVGLLSEAVVQAGWSPPVVVGGHAVEFYTAGDYPTVDIDLASASEPVAEVLGAWGFSRQGRHFYDDALGLVVEVPGGQLAPEQLTHVAGVRVGWVTAFVLGIEDLIVDRLCACKRWNDRESCSWARVLLAGADELDAAYLDERAAAEDVCDVLERLRGETT